MKPVDKALQQESIYGRCEHCQSRHDQRENRDFYVCDIAEDPFYGADEPCLKADKRRCPYLRGKE